MAPSVMNPNVREKPPVRELEEGEILSDEEEEACNGVEPVVTQPEATTSKFNIHDMMADFFNSPEVTQEAEEDDVFKEPDTVVLGDNTTTSHSAGKTKPECAKAAIENRPGQCGDKEPNTAKRHSSNLLEGYGYVERPKSVAAMEVDAFEANLRRAAEASMKPRQHGYPALHHRLPLPPMPPYLGYHVPPPQNGTTFDAQASMQRFMAQFRRDIDARPFYGAYPPMHMHNRPPLIPNLPNNGFPPVRPYAHHPRTVPMGGPMVMNPPFPGHPQQQQQQNHHPKRHAHPRGAVLRKAPCVPEQYRRK